METTTRVCKVCGRELPAEDFIKNAWGVTNVCKDCHHERVKEGVQKRKKMKQQAVDAVNARNLRLQDFTPRELLSELKRKGYEFKATYTETHVLDSKDF